MPDDVTPPAGGPCPVADANCDIDLDDTLNVHLWHHHTEEELADTLVRFALDNDRLRAERDRLQAEAAETAARAWCQCCVFGNHMERCTCAATRCCHPEKHPGIADSHITRLSATVDDLRGRLDDIESACRLRAGDELAAEIRTIIERLSPAQAALLAEEAS